ncbi:NarK family nitrate/nitrite MFS transporter [Aliinostoc sp. HNIBRCY26]|uniref:NarK family nitrate/nitrite MFS transporter n=1 Tax=Aliinostoc sp. HNIBRCY26 TaxID=3418997 RepID=UPI003D075F86
MFKIFSFIERYRILHLSWIAFFVTFMVWFSFAPLATIVQQDLGLTPQQLKVIAICNLSLTIPARIVIGMILDRWGPRLTFAGVLIFAIVPCLITATAIDFPQLVWGSLMNGIMGAGFVVGVRMVAEWFPPKEIGTAQGIYGGWGNFGAAAAQILLPSVAVATASVVGGSVNWRGAIATIGILSVIYGVIYWCSVQDTPPGKTYRRPQRHGALEVTSRASFWAMTTLDLGLLLSLGLLTWPLTGINFLTHHQVILVWVTLAVLYGCQFYQSWQVNRELIGSLNPLATDFLKSDKRYPPSERYQFRQIALLALTYLTNFGSQITVISVLPTFFEQTFRLNPVSAGLVAASYPVLNLISRPSGGWISDRWRSRKWVMTLLSMGIGAGYLLMAGINASWSLPIAIAVTIFCAYFVQAGAGATFSIVPLIKHEITGQIAGSVGAYGNVGGVIYLTIYSSTNAQTLFITMGVLALICASLCGFFLQEPKNSFVDGE